MTHLPESKKISTLAKMLVSASSNKYFMNCNIEMQPVSGVCANNWSTLCTIVEHLKQGNATIVSEYWFDKYEREQKKDLAKIESWSTYSNCYDLVFCYNKGCLDCCALIWNGDNMNGHVVSKRFIATIRLPLNFILEIETYVMSAFHSKLEYDYDQYLESQRTEWIEKQKNIILTKQLKTEI